MKKSWMCSIFTAVVLTSAMTLSAQNVPPPPMDALGGPQDMQGGPGGPGPFGPHMEILGFEEMHAGKVVTGSPYSAVAVTESTQTLADGTSINRKVQANVYRDSQGRLRREATLPAIGPLAASGTSKTVVLIHDPVAGTAFALHPDQKIAMQLPAHAKGPGGKNRGDALSQKFENHIQAEIANGTLKKDDLGTQTINGISAQGTRYTRTIPAGQIGNDKPITVTNERWYSNDLQIVVKSTRNDPRFGQTTYTLTNIQKQEPAASLFIVPSDYTVKQASEMHGKGGHHHGSPDGMPGGPNPMDMPPPPAQ